MTRLLATWGVAIALACGIPAAANDNPRMTMLVELGGRELEGMPLAWTNSRVFLLARDGRLWEFPPRQAGKFRKISSSFSSYSAAEIRGQLEREFAGRLEITGTGHYLVAHPRGKSGWAQRFEDLYRSCVHYFTLRDLKVHEPDFPLVAVVWPRREDFVHQAASDGAPVASGVLGFYSPATNRVSLYEQSSGGSAGSRWQQTDATIIHEATHQMAFNTGVHNRFAPTPRWLAEGLGTMFEAPGVWNWRDYPQVNDRVNHGRLAQFRQGLKSGRKSGAFVDLLSSDRQFESNPGAAYAEAWAWVFFLTETYPRKFGEYVSRVAKRPNFEDYPPARRLADFTGIFGEDLRLLEAHFLRFVAALN